MNIGWIFVIGALLILILLILRSRWEKNQVMKDTVFSTRLDAFDARLVRYYDVMSFIRAGQMIKAIKTYREDTGASLSEAKAAVERMDQQMRLEVPHVLAKQTPLVAPAKPLDLGAWREEVRRLILEGKKIPAIKLYREQTGVELREAKRAVEQMEEELHMDWKPLPTPPPVVVEPSEEVRRLILEGRKIPAIKLYREQTGVGLREAKDTVEAMEKELCLGLE